MKKIKIIGLIVLVLVCIMLAFASCKKTKAIEPGYGYGSVVYIDSVGDGYSNFLGVYQPNLINSPYSTVLIQIDYGGNDYLAVYCERNTGNNESRCNLVSGINGSILTTNYIDYNDLIAYTVNIGSVAGDNYTTLYITLTTLYVNRTTPSTSYLDQLSNTIVLEQLQNYNDYASFINGYASSTHLPVNYLYRSGLGNQYIYSGLYNCYLYDCLDYVIDSWSELLNEVYDIYVEPIIKDNSPLAYSCYNLGYQAGYSEGYQAGESAGYTAGYSAGYSAGEGDGYRSGYDTGYDDGYDAGLSAGYNNGYADGLADNVAGQTQAYEAGYGQGRHDGYIEGYDRGYEIGYDDGYNNGFSGATPMSRATTLVGSIFGAIGSILAIQLFPGFTLGLLILVPLFFAVLGLILWIWRRN